MRKGALIAVATLAAVLSTAPVSRAQDEGFTPAPMLKGLEPLAVGSPAPDFTVKGLDGKTFVFSSERGNVPQLLVFWSIFCEPCREEMPLIQRMSDEYSPSGKLGVIAVNMDGEPFKDAIEGFVNQYKYSLKVILDELDDQGEQFIIADPYQVKGTPVIYIVDGSGKISGYKEGRIDDEAELRKMISRVLPGQ